VSNHDTPVRYLSMTLRVYTLDTATGARTFLPVSEPSVRNAVFDGPCFCPKCRAEVAE